MQLNLGLLVFLTTLGISISQDLPTLYQYFATPDGQNATGLVAQAGGFRLNGKPIRIVSGAMHYFRIHPDLWRDRLRKLRATGANTVETYVPWNLHEPRWGQWDFGDLDYDHSIFLNITRFIEIAQEEDLLFILRPGPFICTEFEFGGFPSYLLRDYNMQVRLAYEPYTMRVRAYLEQLFNQVRHLQFTRGGPIIMVQIENEYASFHPVRSTEYMSLLRETILANGITELLVTSDNPWHGTNGALPNVFKTVNFGAWTDVDKHLRDTLAFQPNLPIMVMEFWDGWFDHWAEGHVVVTDTQMRAGLELVLGPRYNGSLNFYMFHGGTNFGFNSGADHYSTTQPNYSPVITSYDYDAPLSEAGDYTAKYNVILELVTRYQVPELRKPLPPPASRKVAFPTVQLQQVLTFVQALDQVPSWAKFEAVNRVNMEKLDINIQSGQSQGYILYRKTVTASTARQYQFRAGPVRDFGQLLVDGVLQPFPGNQIWMNTIQNYTFNLSAGEHTLDLLIENMGRVNVGSATMFKQHKGLLGSLSDVQEFYHLDGAEVQNIEIMALEFKNNWVSSLTSWRNVTGGEIFQGPVLFRSTFTLNDESPPDTFLNMSGWTKGIVFINGFNLGRFWNVGPQQTLYCPGPFLRTGVNTVTIFEQLKHGTSIQFSATPNLGPPTGPPN